MLKSKYQIKTENTKTDLYERFASQIHRDSAGMFSLQPSSLNCVGLFLLLQFPRCPINNCTDHVLIAVFLQQQTNLSMHMLMLFRENRTKCCFLKESMPFFQNLLRFNCYQTQCTVVSGWYGGAKGCTVALVQTFWPSQTFLPQSKVIHIKVG